MLYILMALFTILVVIADQVTKYLTVSHIYNPGLTGEELVALADAFHVDASVLPNLPTNIPVIPNVISFSHVDNDGGAWSMFPGMQWLFAAVFLLFTAAIVWEFSKKRLPFTTFERWCIVGIFAGGLGNMIDRLRLGYVVDMIKTDFITFPIFNVADCFITCGCIALMVSLIFFNKAFWKDDKKK